MDFGDRAADASVDFVEDVEACRSQAGEHALDCEHGA